MKSAITLFAAGAFAAFVSCDVAPVTEPDASDVTFDPPLSLSTPPDGGTCPDVYWESSELLDNDVTVTWTSAFGGFNYGIGTGYTTGVVTWSLSSGSAAFVSFGARTRGKTFTPRGRDHVAGSVANGAAAGGSLPVTVTMDEMHRSEDDIDGDGIPDWQGEMGNGHFWLILDIDDGLGDVTTAKFGVNFHLEDPDGGFADRCPTG